VVSLEFWAEGRRLGCKGQENRWLCIQQFLQAKPYSTRGLSNQKIDFPLAKI